MRKNQKMAKGITLISLVVTVIVLLLLAGISVSMLTGENGLILNAGNAKEQTELEKEKELIETVVMKTINKGKFGILKQENLQKRLDNAFGEEKKAKVYEEEDGNFPVLVENRLYNVDKDGKVELVDSNFKFSKREFITQIENNELGASAEKPYEIKCIEDLLDFSFIVNGIKVENDSLSFDGDSKDFQNEYINLVRNLNFKSELSYENAERVNYGDVNQDGRVDSLITELTTGKGWICIGGYANWNKFFRGTFLGETHKISNLYINETNYLKVNGLFGRNMNSTINNLGVTGNIFCNSQYAGGIGGYNTLANMNNCYFYGTIENILEEKTPCETGGLNGFFSGTINNCHCKGNIIAHNTANRGYAGGICGSFTGIIKDSYNEASIHSARAAGGITGEAPGGSGYTIMNCYNLGDIEAANDCGGIVGYGYHIIQNCYNNGNITSTGNNVGGIAGECYAGSYKIISECYNTGNVTGNNGVGGILGNVTSTKETQIVEKCYNKGNVSGTDKVSGIVGSTNTKITMVKNCYNLASVTGTGNNVSGIIIKMYDETLANVISCYNIGNIVSKKVYGITNRLNVENSYYLQTCGATDSNGTAISSEDLKNLASTLDKAYTINAETGEITISETEIQNVWTDDTQNINGGYPIFK